MTPENWPEPKRIIGKLGDLCTFKSLQTNKGDVLYTATQVREIVRMEVDACAELCLSLRDTAERAKASKRVEEALATNDMQRQLSALRHDSDVSLYNCAFENAANAIRTTLKENKDAD